MDKINVPDDKLFFYSCHEQCAYRQRSPSSGPWAVSCRVSKHKLATSLVLLSPQFVFNGVVLSQYFEATMVDTHLFLVGAQMDGAQNKAPASQMLRILFPQYFCTDHS